VTLIEIMLAISIIAIVSAICYPAIGHYMKTYKFKAAARDMLTAAMQARSNAVRDNASWRLQVKTYGSTRRLDLLDPNDNVNATYDLASYGAGIHLLNPGANASCGNATKNWNGDTISQIGENPAAPGQRLSFTGRGFSDAGSIFLANADNQVCFAVSVSASGVIKMHRYNGASPYSNAHWD